MQPSEIDDGCPCCLCLPGVQTVAGQREDKCVVLQSRQIEWGVWALAGHWAWPVVVACLLLVTIIYAPLRVM